MAKTNRKYRRNYVGGRITKDRKVINAFFSDVVGLMTTTSRASMRKMAQRGLVMLVRQSTYSGYTGVLRNSYQAAIFDDIYQSEKRARAYFKASGGDFRERGALKGLDKTDARNAFKAGNGRVMLYTSLGIDGVERIVKPKGHSVKRQVKRNPNSTKYIPNYDRAGKGGFRYNRGGEEMFKRHGYGRMTSRLKKTHTNSSSVSVVFDTPTPYVHFVEKHEGSYVFPRGFTEDGKKILMHITKEMIDGAVRRYNRNAKRR